MITHELDVLFLYIFFYSRPLRVASVEVCGRTEVHITQGFLEHAWELYCHTHGYSYLPTGAHILAKCLLQSLMNYAPQPLPASTEAAFIFKAMDFGFVFVCGSRAISPCVGQKYVSSTAFLFVIIIIVTLLGIYCFSTPPALLSLLLFASLQFPSPSLLL